VRGDSTEPYLNPDMGAWSDKTNLTVERGKDSTSKGPNMS